MAKAMSADEKAKARALAMELLSRGVSVRETADKCGLHRSMVGRLAVSLKCPPATVSVTPETEKKVVQWIERISEVLGHVEDLVSDVARAPSTRTDPDMFRAVMGGAKILVDAVAQIRMVPDAGRDSSSPQTPSGDGPLQAAAPAAAVETEQRPAAVVQLHRAV